MYIYLYHIRCFYSGIYIYPTDVRVSSYRDFSRYTMMRELQLQHLGGPFTSLMFHRSYINHNVYCIIVDIIYIYVYFLFK